MALKVRKGAQIAMFKAMCNEATLRNSSVETYSGEFPGWGKGLNAVGKGRGSTPAFLPAWRLLKKLKTSDAKYQSAPLSCFTALGVQLVSEFHVPVLPEHYAS